MARSLVLVLEDEVLISMDLEATLIDAGFAVALARSCAEAADFLDDHRPDVAIRDVRLSDGDCTVTAKALVSLGMPFILHTGALLDGERDKVLLWGHTWANQPHLTPWSNRCAH